VNPLKKRFLLGVALVLSSTSGIAMTKGTPKRYMVVPPPQSVCMEIRRLLHLRRSGQAPQDFEIDYEELDGTTDYYPNLDIDNDGINDSVIKSCGASINTTCHLDIKLSSGENFQLVKEERFFLVRIASAIYVITGESLSAPETRYGKRRAYQITRQLIKPICSHI
jgi:hypothetical protein